MPQICRLDQISPETGLEAAIEDSEGVRFLALFSLGGEVHAYLNACPHQGRNLSFAPNEFLLGKDDQLICPHHGACFNLKTGECVQGPCQGASLTRVAVRVAENAVWLDDGQDGNPLEQ